MEISKVTRSNLVSLAVASLTILCPSIGKACIVLKTPTADSSFESSKKVFIGQVVRFKQTKIPWGSDFAVKEDVTYRVLKAWKGVRVGALVHTTAEVSGGGSCGMSVRLSTDEDVEYLHFASDPKGGKEPDVNWDIWMVYDQPSMASRSYPMTFDPIVQDQKKLDLMVVNLQEFRRALELQSHPVYRPRFKFRRRLAGGGDGGSVRILLLSKNCGVRGPPGL